ncbi:MAG: diiron oxygenase [Cyanobacteria bacterium P01_F01_bin.143]
MQTTTVKNNSQDSSISHSQALLQKISKTWHRRARVKTKEIDMKSTVDDSLPDFRVDLLPFRDHPDFLQASPQMQNKILSCGWLAYNEKTIDIEAKVINPACNHIIYGEVPGADDEISQMIASETLVDESYHILLVNKACHLTRRQRNLQFLKLPDFNLGIEMQREQLQLSEHWQKVLVQLATATVSELFISDYLNLLAHDQTIQPFNRLVVDTHRQDEMAHGTIFNHLAKHIYSQLNREQKEFFMQILPKPVRWFANTELTVWKAMLEQIGFAHTERVIDDCIAANEVNLLRIDYTGIMSLAEELGILDSNRGVDSFGEAGLFDSNSQSENRILVTA